MNQTPVIREFLQGDYDSLMELWDETDMGGRERGDNLETIRATIDIGGRLFVMEGDWGAIIGSSWLSLDGRRMYLHHFAIHPDYQGKGLSKGLLDKSMEYCRAVGLQVKLEVHKENYKAIRLYEGYGFRDLEGYKVSIIRDI